MLKRVAVTAVAAAAVAGLSAGAAMSAQRQFAAQSLDFGYVTGAAHPYGLAMAQFKKIAESETAGTPDALSIHLTPLYGGGDDIKLLGDISGGAEAGGAVSTAVFPTAGIKAFNALQLPGLISSYQLESKVISNSGGIASRMLNIVTKNTKLTALGLLEGGMRGIALRQPITSLSQLKGMKIRTPQSPLLADIYSALGATPLALRLGDVAQALGATGANAVDGLDANSGLVRVQNFNSAGVRDFVVANTFPFTAAVVVNDNVWNGLTPAQQKALKDAAANLAQYSLSVNDTTNPASPTSAAVAALCSGANNRPKVQYQVLTKPALAEFYKAEAKVIRKYTRKDKQTAAFYTAILKKKVALQKAAKSNPSLITPTENPPASCLGPPVGP
jgi:TRAP-type C4-dicarboxylate transport system substrate-binding protein